MIRDKIGRRMNREECESYLNDWISRYVTDQEEPEEMKARYPLRNAWIEVQDLPSKPGSFAAIVFLQPHFQTDKPATSRLIAELPSSTRE
jgi:type VI secretion system protein ImpC